MSNYKTYFDRWFYEVWFKGHDEAIYELMSPDVIIHGLDKETQKGPQAFEAFYHKFRNAFPVVDVQLRHLVKTADQEAAYCTVRAKNARKKNVEFNGIVIGQFKDGKLTEVWNCFDFLGMYQQLGLELTVEEDDQNREEEEEFYVPLASGLGINE